MLFDRCSSISCCYLPTCITIQLLEYSTSVRCCLHDEGCKESRPLSLDLVVKSSTDVRPSLVAIFPLVSLSTSFPPSFNSLLQYVFIRLIKSFNVTEIPHISLFFSISSAIISLPSIYTYQRASYTHRICVFKGFNNNKTWMLQITATRISNYK